MAKKTKADLTGEERFLLDAYLINEDEDMLYSILKGDKTKATDENFHIQALRYLRSTPVKDYLNERRGTIFSNMQNSEAVQYRSTDSIVAALEAEIKYLKGKERADALMKIADLLQLKKLENAPEEERVHFYLPLHICKDCPNKGNLVK